MAYLNAYLGDMDDMDDGDDYMGLVAVDDSNPQPGDPDFTGPVDTSPQPGDPTFVGPVDTGVTPDQSQPGYTLPVEIFEKTLPIILQAGGVQPIPSPIPGSLPPGYGQCYPQSYTGPLPAGASYCPSTGVTATGIGVAGILALVVGIYLLGGK